MDEAQIKKNQDFLREMYLAGFEKASAFMALIVTAGYAGAFTVWDHVEKYLTYCERLLVAGLFIASLTLFVGWQIRGQWTLGQQQLGIARLIESGVTDFPEMIERWRVDQAKVRARIQAQLPIVFGVTVILGGLGSMILLVACIRHLVTGPA
jgi:hypothetical protein